MRQCRKSIPQYRSQETNYKEMEGKIVQQKRQNVAYKVKEIEAMKQET